jgi:hypothetical protein
MVRSARALAVVAIMVGFAGCGGGTATNKPADALRGFYGALLHDRDFGRACQFAAPRFYLRASGIVAINVAGSARPHLPAKSIAAASRNVGGSCPDLVRRIYRERGDAYPFSYWRIDQITIHPSARQADAVTSDGSSGLTIVGHEWRLAWALS